MDKSLQAMTGAGFQALQGGVDLNGEGQFGQSPRLCPGDRHERRQDAVCPNDALSAVDDVWPLRGALQRRLRGYEVNEQSVEIRSHRTGDDRVGGQSSWQKQSQAQDVLPTGAVKPVCDPWLRGKRNKLGVGCQPL